MKIIPLLMNINMIQTIKIRSIWMNLENSKIHIKQLNIIKLKK